MSDVVIDTEGDNISQGAGIIDTVNMMAHDLNNPAEFAVDGVAFGVELLGFVASPLSSLLSAGIGWLIEHIAFLEEPLNLLAGDPEQIRHIAAVWGEQVRGETGSVATDYQRALNSDIPSWEGVAATAYHKTGDFMVDMINALENAAVGVSGAIRGSGVLVATVRGIIRDLIADVVAEIVIAFGAAVASSWFTFGGSLAAFTGWAVARGAATASRIATKISTLLSKLSEVMAKFSKLSGAADQLSNLARRADNSADSLSDVARRKDAAQPAGFNDDVVSNVGRFEDLDGALTDRLGAVGERVDQVDDLISKRVDDGDRLVDTDLSPGGLGYHGVHETVKAVTDEEEKYQHARENLDYEQSSQGGG